VTFGAIGGLSNRLRGIFSRFEPPMSVVWERYWNAADGHFLDVFEPVDGLTFVDGPATEESCGAVGTDNGWHQRYRLLRPTAALRERIAGIADALGPYNAMHVRRTDHLTHCRHNGLRPTSDAEFLAWATLRDGPIFLATDNAETRLTMLRAIGPRLVYQGPMADSTHEAVRGNSLADAVVDLFVCVGAESFLGSAHSSFSELVTHLRELR
jgi:hypothetical protein